MAYFNQKQRLALVSFALFYFILFLSCSLRSARDPGSAFFQPRAGYQPVHSPKRIHDSLRFISTLNDSIAETELSTPASPSGNASICVTVVTVKRPVIQLLDTTVGSLLDNLTPNQRSTLALHVLFALNRPTDHPDYNLPWASNAIDRRVTYDEIPDAPRTSLRRLEMSKNYKKKSLIDYRLALQSCYNNTDAPWIMMLEDDVVAESAWYTHMTQSIQKIEEWKDQGKLHDWLYLRLFYTEKFLGWNSENWAVYLGWSVLIVALVAAVGIFSRRKVRPLRDVLTNPFLAIVCLICVPSVIGLYFLAGRVTMRPMQPGIHLMNKHGCCSQAMVFPREKVPLVMNQLEIVQDWIRPKAVDTVIEMVGNENAFDRLAVSPPLMQHVGAASYKTEAKKWKLDYSIGGAHGVWSMDFETEYEQARFAHDIPNVLYY
ncbi:hypothetical protein FE257_011238 [Aspergillus nanangensis]|uniref:Integral membrane protein n=1 Tax=Aspergillus nanangensis TaxID=2582783 RepID=A0AAD4CHZ4_ASPNN|nr:hypothetical protein FE257_011238 [Aspergillus nanangensis]